MKTISFCYLALILSITNIHGQTNWKRISVSEYRNKMEAGWIGQMAGVGWGGPTEFKYKGEIMPEAAVPEWKPEMINTFWQDDLYVEMTFLRTLETYGWNVSTRQAGIDFANKSYSLWAANSAGRTLIREGIAPPDSGHPYYNKDADSIDYQIEADYSGLISPGMPNSVIRLSDTFGRIMNYGDGLYGGNFVGGMYAAAFFETDPLRLVKAGLACLPEGSQYRECIEDTIRWYQENPDNWQSTWEKVEEKYNRDPDYRRFSSSSIDDPFNIDAKLNGAYIAIGLLYGKSDPEQTMLISMRCGQDSDCNPSNAAGILFTAIGLESIPPKYRQSLKRTETYSYSSYDFDKLLDVCEKLAKEATVLSGGRIEVDSTGEALLIIPQVPAKPGPLEESFNPGPLAISRFTPAERAEINYPTMQGSIDRILPGWTLTAWGMGAGPGIRDEYSGEFNACLISSPDSQHPSRLTRIWKVAKHGRCKLDLRVARFIEDQTVDIRINDKTIDSFRLTKDNTQNKWLSATIDLSKFAGEEIKIDVLGSGTTVWKRLEVIQDY